MKNTVKLAILLTIGLLSLSSIEAATNKTITYKNQRGSLMTLTWHHGTNDTGNLTGTFTTAVGNCQQDMNKPMPLQGYFNGNAIALTVNFPHCKQVVAMTGNLTADQNELKTLWFDTTQASDPSRKDWNSNIIGADYFKRQA